MKTAVVFSSGFFGFFAHAGFLAALRELKIRPAGFAGSSSGAILAAMAACGMDDGSIRSILFGLKKGDFWDPDPLYSIFRYCAKGFRGYTGYLKGQGFARLLEKIPVEKIEHCRAPLAITATNLTRMREEVFTEGSLVKALHASGAVPGLFKPVEIGDSLYVDGGMVNKAPVKAIADLVKPERIIVHFISSVNLDRLEVNHFLSRRMTPWHIYELSVNISRRTAYGVQCELVRERGIEIVEVRSPGPAVGPNRLSAGREAYERACEAAIRVISDVDHAI